MDEVIAAALLHGAPVAGDRDQVVATSPGRISTASA